MARASGDARRAEFLHFGSVPASHFPQKFLMALSPQSTILLGVNGQWLVLEYC
jgi:hypothetical protein